MKLKDDEIIRSTIQASTQLLNFLLNAHEAMNSSGSKLHEDVK